MGASRFVQNLNPSGFVCPRRRRFINFLAVVAFVIAAQGNINLRAQTNMWDRTPDEMPPGSQAKVTPAFPTSGSIPSRFALFGTNKHEPGSFSTSKLGMNFIHFNPKCRGKALSVQPVFASPTEDRPAEADLCAPEAFKLQIRSETLACYYFYGFCGFRKIPAADKSPH